MRLSSERVRLSSSLEELPGVCPLATKYVKMAPYTTTTTTTATTWDDDEHSPSPRGRHRKRRLRQSIAYDSSDDEDDDNTEDWTLPNNDSNTCTAQKETPRTEPNRLVLCEYYYNSTLAYCKQSASFPPPHHVTITVRLIERCFQKFVETFLRWSLSTEAYLRGRARISIVNNETPYEAQLRVATYHHWLGMYTRICNLCLAYIRRHGHPIARRQAANLLERCIRRWIAGTRAMARPLSIRCTTPPGGFVTISPPHIGAIVGGLICFLHVSD